MVHARDAIWIVQEFVKRRTAGFLAPEISGVFGGVDLLEQSVQVPQPLGPGGVLQRLVLRQDVDEAVTGVVAVLQEQLAAAVAERFYPLPHLALGSKSVHCGLRRSGEGPVCARPRG